MLRLDTLMASGKSGKTWRSIGTTRQLEIRRTIGSPVFLNSFEAIEGRVERLIRTMPNPASNLSPRPTAPRADVKSREVATFEGEERSSSFSRTSLTVARVLGARREARRFDRFKDC